MYKLWAVFLLKQVISRELDFSEGFTIGLVDALLDHMEVMGTEDKKVVHVTVYLKGMPEQQNYVIKRSKGKLRFVPEHTHDPGGY